MQRLRSRHLSLAALVLLAVPAPAQGRIDLPKPQPSGTPQEQKPNPEAEQVPEAAAQAPSGGFWDAAKTPSELLFREFEAAQSTDPKLRGDFLDRLRALGLGTEATALYALGSPFPPTVHLAAELLEWVGSPEQNGRDVVSELVVAASRVPSVEAVGACLETARRLNLGHLPAIAVKLIGHPRRQVRTVGESRIARDPHEEHVPGLLQFLRFGRDTDVRLRAARLLAVHVDVEEVREALRETLASEDIEVIFVALEALSGRGTPVEVGWLRDQAGQAATLLESAYLLYAVLLVQDREEASQFDEGQVRLLRRMCDDPDVFISGVGAACMGEFLFRGDYREEMERWNALLPALLVRAVGGAEFYPQYARFMPLAEGTLRRISGEDLAGPARSAWPEWYAANAASFQLVRGSLDVAGGELGAMVLRWTRGGRTTVLGGPDAPWAEGMHLLGPQSLASVGEALAAAGVLDSTVLPGVYGPEQDPVGGRLELVVEGRRKLLTFRGAGMQPWVEELFALLDAAWEDTRWQELLDTGEGPEPVRARLAAFEDLEGSGRAAAYAEVSRGRIGALTDSALAAWCADLQQVPGLADAWSAELAREFLEQAALRAERTPALGGTLVALALQRPELMQVDDVSDSFAELEEPERSELSVAAFELLGLEACTAALADERVSVRVSASRALGRLGAEALPALRTAVDDAHALVVRAALRSIGEVADPAAVDAVAPWAQIGMPVDLQCEALWALGRMGDPGSVPLLERAAAEGSDAAVRIAGLEGLAMLGGAEAGAALQRLFPAFVDSTLESSWARAASAQGAAAARRMAETYLLDEDPAVARRAALLGGGLGLPAAAPALIELLDTMPRDPALLEALTMTLAVDFRAMPDPAGTYRVWWEQYGALGAAGWLRRAAQDSGFALDERFADTSEVRAADSVEVLLDVVERGPEALRGLAAYYLHALTGIDTQPLLLGTPRRELMRRAQPWSDWLQRARG